MGKTEARIYYLYHSSYAIETANSFMIFDYFNDQTNDQAPRSLEHGVITQDLLQMEKPIYVFVTHSHSDHYHPLIFSWESINPNITYILSYDIDIKERKPNYHFMSPYETLALGDIKVKAYGTTDQGVSYMVTVDKMNIFHAGDLNWWHWKSFTKEQLLQEELDYKQEIIKLKESVDIAFTPVDPRLEEGYYLGGLYLAQLLQPKLLIPMHFRDHLEISRDFAEKLEDYPVKAAIIKARGQEISFSKAIN